MRLSFFSGKLRTSSQFYMACICRCHREMPQHLDIIGWMFSVQCKCTSCPSTSGGRSNCRVRIRSSCDASHNYIHGLCSNCRNSCSASFTTTDNSCVSAQQTEHSYNGNIIPRCIFTDHVARYLDENLLWRYAGTLSMTTNAGRKRTWASTVKIKDIILEKTFTGQCKKGKAYNDKGFLYKIN